MNFAIARLARVAFLWTLLLGSLAWAEEPQLLHSPRSETQAGRPLVVDGTLVGTSSVDHLTLHFRTGGGAWRELPMELQYGDLFRAVIPGPQVVPPSIEYFVDGVGFTGRHFDLFRNALKPAKVDVVGASPEPPPVTQQTPDTSSSATDHGIAEGRGHPVERGGFGQPQGTPDTTSASHPTTGTSRGPDASANSASPPEHPIFVTPAHPSPSGPVFYRRSAFDEDLEVYSATPANAVPTTTQPVGPGGTSTLVYDREQIRALGARSVFDVLDVVPGLTTSRDVQGNWRVAFRGLRDEPGVLFLLNGHRLNNFFDGEALANLPVDNLARIEVIRGPGAAAYGANAFLGVVNLVTDREDGARATVAGGSYKALDGHLTAATHAGKLQLFLDADALRQDGYALDVTSDALNQETIAQGRDPGAPAGTTNDGRELVNVGAGFSYGDVRSQAGVQVRFLRESRRALIGLFDTVGSNSHLGWSAAMADATLEHWFSDRFQLSLRAYADLQSTDRAFQLSPGKFFANPVDDATFFNNGLFERFAAKTQTFGLDARAQVQVADSNQLGLGVQADRGSLTDYSQELNFDAAYHPIAFTKPDGLQYPDQAVPAATQRLTVGLFAEDVWTLGQAFQLDFGVRLDAVQLPEPTDPAVSSFATSFDPRAAILLTPLQGLQLHLSYARAFRPPTVAEYAQRTPDTFFTHGQYEGSASLVPATADTLELGGDLTQGVEGARIHIRGTLFFENLTHPIAAVDTSGNIVPLANREGERVWGAEGSARVELSRRASAWVNASFFRATDTETPDSFNLLTDTPQARFNAGLTLPLGPYFDFDVYAEIGAERRNLERSVLEQIRRYSIPAYSLVTAQVRTEKIADHFELALVGHNVFDVQRFDDVPRPDRIPGLLPREGVSASLILTASY